MATLSSLRALNPTKKPSPRVRGVIAGPVGVEPRAFGAMTRRRAKKPARRLAVALIRVSKGVDVQELGAEAQRHALTVWAEREGYDLVWVEEVEEVSGGSPLEERTGLLEAIALVEARKAKALVFHRFDRFARDPFVALLVERELEKHGAALAFAEGGGDGDDPSAVLMRRMLAAFAEFERKMIKARIKAALAVKRQRGEMTGRAPYGFKAVDGPMRTGKDGQPRAVKVLVEEPSEQATLMRARELAADPSSTVRSIQAQLTAEGRMNRRGNPFGLEELSKMLKGAESEAA